MKKDDLYILIGTVPFYYFSWDGWLIGGWLGYFGAIFYGGVALYGSYIFVKAMLPIIMKGINWFRRLLQK